MRIPPLVRITVGRASALLVIVGCLVGCGVAQPTATPALGVSVGPATGTDAATDQELAQLARGGATWVRIGLDWSVIEPQPGHWDWSYVDGLVSAANAVGLRVLAVPAFTPQWVRGLGTTNRVPPQNAASFAKFVRDAVLRYRNRGVRAWEIWNEPNSSDYWQPRPDARGYGLLFAATAEAVRSTDPTATVVTGGLTRGPDTPSGTRLSQTTFLTQLYESGAVRAADAIGVHPYTFPFRPTDTSHTVVGDLLHLPQLHDLMVRHGDPTKPIWITEFGAPTGTAPDSVSEGDQAEVLREARGLIRPWNWVGAFIVYELRDSGSDPADTEQDFGLFRRDLSAKPALSAIVAQSPPPPP